MKKNSIFKNLGIYLIVFALIMGIAYFYQGNSKEETEEISFSQFVDYLSEQKVESLNLTDAVVTATIKGGSTVITYIPSSIEWSVVSQKYVIPQMEAGTIKEMSSDKPVATPWYISILPTAIMIILLVVFWFMIMNQGGNGKVLSFGKSRAHMVKDSDGKKVTFADVAGLDEEKEELEEVVDFLKNPQKYRDLGARIPKGMLLVGPPGTGKTYISKATAGEAGVPFFSISGSDFVEMFVGVGASRVRDLFEQAKKASPCIVFIDEIDAVGRKRGSGIGGGHDEREQTLNQLLVEMDGFGENTGIIVLAATNRPDILDPALLRPGRFDRQIVIGVPDIKGREEIFKVHSKNKPLAEDVNPQVLARRTPGFTPADIENMMNEAALLTARRNGRIIRMEEVEEAITKVIAGTAKRSRVITEKERRLTAFHEAGHAVCARALPDSDPVHQITIMPRGMAGGFTMTLPKEDKYYTTKTDMKNMIIHLLGGRVAEMLVLDDISTGASNDIERATDVARDMVTKYGFSEKLGPINYGSAEEVFLGNDFAAKKNFSEETAAEIDAEIRRFVEEGFAEAEKILSEHLSELNTVAEALLALETIDGEQFEKLYTGQMTAEEIISETKAREAEKQKQNESEAAETEKALAEAKAREKEEKQARAEESEYGDEFGEDDGSPF